MSDAQDKPQSSWRELLARFGMWCGVGLGALGLPITFYPGARAGWYGVAAVLVLTGLISARWRVRLLAVLLSVVLALEAWEGYREGLRYEEYMRQHPPKGLTP